MSAPSKSAREIFLVAVETTEPGQRKEYLDQACGADLGLRRHVEALLKVHDEPDSLLDQERINAQLGVDDDSAATAALDHRPLERPGTQIGPYKLLQEIGEGGMGVVYMAEQKAPVERRVALKIIKPGMDTRQVIARFEAERQALAMMDHPNIAKVLDAGTTDSGRPYFVMELVNGIPVTQFCDEQHLTARERLELFIPICQAVQHAHQKGIIHRDIKPSNILMALYDGRPVPKIIDFGVAKATGGRLTEKTMFTGLGQIVGTIEYMSPEQANRNQLDIDTRSDVYSLGVVLYELLTGDTPFDKQRLRSAAFDELLRIIREEEPPKPSTRLSSSETLASVAANRHVEPAKLSALVRGELDWIVMKTLEKDRARRYESASSLAADVQHYLNDEPVAACPPSAGYRFRKFARRNKGRLVTASLLAAALLVTVGGVGWAVRDRAAQRAEVAREKSARQERVTTQVELFLAEADRLMQEQQWPEALAAARRAEAALAGGDAPQDVQARVEQAVTDLELVAHLEEIRLLTCEVKEQSFDYSGANLDYAAAFREFGVDVDALPADEAAKGLRSQAGVLPALIVALDDWARFRRYVKDAAGAEVLSGLAQSLDGDPWRRRVREAVAAKNKQALVELADSAELAHQAPSTLELFAWALQNNESSEPVREVLSTALRKHPGDFWLHFTAANANSKTRPPRYEKAIGHYTAALALRPHSTAVLVNLGHALHKQGNLDEAIAEYHTAIELDPKFAMAHYNLGVALTEQGKLDEAIDCYHKAIELDPKFVNAHHNLGHILAKQGKLDEAIDCFRRAIELDPKFARAHGQLGSALSDQGKLDEAIDCFRHAIELEPKNAMAHINLGSALSNQGNLDEAIDCFRRAIELDPKNATAHSNLGVVLQDQGQLDEAIACFQKAIELNPGWAPTYSNLGGALKLQGRLDEAIAECRTAIELNPKFALAHNNLGAALADQEKLDEAIAEYRRAIELDPKDAMAHNNLGGVLDKKGKLDEAIDCYRRALELDPKDADAYVNLGIDLHDQGQLDEAVACFHQAIELDPKLARAHSALGVALKERGKLDEAIDCYRQAINLDPKNTTAHSNLGIALKDQGKLDEAIAEYHTAIELDSKLAAAHYNLGIALQDQGKLDEAIACYRQAIELDPKDADAHFNLGNTFYAQGQLVEAIACYHRALELDPQLADAHSNLGAILNRQGQLDEAIAECRQALELDPKHVSAHVNLGNALYKQRKLDEAIACYRQALELDPKYAMAHHNLGNALKDQGKLDEAIGEFRQAIELDPNYAGAYSNLGLAFSSKGDVSEGIATLQKGIDLWPNDVGLRMNMSHVLVNADPSFRDFARAREHAQRGTELAPENPGIWENLGEAQYGCGEFAEAAANLEKAQQLGRELPTGTRLVLAMAYWHTGIRDEACEQYVEAAARLDERNPLEHFRLRDELETLIGAEALIGYCTDRLATDPDSANLLLARAAARAKSGQLDQAAEDYAQALRLLPEPTDPWWRPIVGGISPMVESDEVYERLVALRPQHRGLRIARLPHLASREKWDEVSEQLETAIQLDPNDHEGWCNAAALAHYRGDADAYRRICGELVARFRETDNPAIAQWVAMACLLSPDAGDQLDLARQLAERAVTAGADDAAIHWIYLAKALADYRGGDFETAVASATRSRAHVGRQLCLDATALLVQAMAEHQLERLAEARLSLSAAHELMQQQAPTVDGGAWGRYWCAWLRYHILRREAEALIDQIEDGEPEPHASQDDESLNPGEK